MMLKAITMWQPWASLVFAGAKPLEFRKWDFREKGIKVGQRIAVHAGARKIRLREVQDLLDRLDDEIGSTGLAPTKAKNVLILVAQSLMAGNAGLLPIGTMLGTVRLGTPMPTAELKPEWASVLADSDRLEHCKWAWPFDDPLPFDDQLLAGRGWQGFWNYSINDEVGAFHVKHGEKGAPR